MAFADIDEVQNALAAQDYVCGRALATVVFLSLKLGRPLWRFNRLWYDDPTLFQPRSALEPRRIEPDQKAAPYIRSERQCIVRMPISDAVVFSIHTFVVNS